MREANGAIMGALDVWNGDGYLDLPYESASFRIAVGMPDETAEKDGRLFYVVVHKTYGVIEWSGSLLYNAIQNMKVLQDGLDSLAVKVTDTVVPAGQRFS